jgi:hypothetical protein
MGFGFSHNDHGLMIGAHPIGSLVAKAEAADEYPLLEHYQR